MKHAIYFLFFKIKLTFTKKIMSALKPTRLQNIDFLQPVNYSDFYEEIFSVKIEYDFILV